MPPSFDELLRVTESRETTRRHYEPGATYAATLFNQEWLREHTVSGHELAAMRLAVTRAYQSGGPASPFPPPAGLDKLPLPRLRALAELAGYRPGGLDNSTVPGPSLHPSVHHTVNSPRTYADSDVTVRTQHDSDSKVDTGRVNAGDDAQSVSGANTEPAPVPTPHAPGGEGVYSGTAVRSGWSLPPQSADNPSANSAHPGPVGLHPDDIRTGEICFVGPAGTGKTRALLEFLVGRCKRKANVRVLLARDFRDGHTQSTMKTLENEVFQEGEFGDAVSGAPIRWHNGQQAYLFQNGSEIVVKGLRDGRGIYSTQYDHILVNEAGSPNIDEEDYDQLLRAKRNGVDDLSLLLSDLNPEYEMHWLHQRCDEGIAREVTTKHSDNPTASGSYLHDLASMRDPLQRTRLYEGKRISAVSGSYYQDVMALARESGRIRPVLPQKGVVTHTCWDLGRSDYTAIWFFQRVMNEWHWVDYYESHLEELDHYWAVLETIRLELGLSYGTHCLPHDATSKTLASMGQSVQSQLWNLGMQGEVIVPQTPLTVQHFAVRQAIATSYFDNSRYVEPERHHRHRRGVRFGVQRLLTYRAAEDSRLSVWRPHPEHDLASHGASAFATGVLASPTTRSGPRARVVRDQVDYLPNTENRAPAEGYRRQR